MKATHAKTLPTFTPVTINITCETQEELDALGSLFNSPKVILALSKVSGQSARDFESIYVPFDQCGANIYNFRPIEETMASK